MISIVIAIVILALSIIYLYNTIKKCETWIEKTLASLLITAFLVPITVYYLDRYNIPSHFGWTKFVNTEIWLNFFSTYFSTTIGAIISAFILIVVTKYQMDRTLKENQERDKEQHRLNNMPLLKYEFLDYDVEISNRDSIETNINDGVTGEVNFRINNIGMNTVKKCYLEVKGEVFKEKYIKELNVQSSIEKDKFIEIKLLLTLIPENYNFKFIIYYQDLLNNWYVQELDVQYQLLPFVNGIRRETYTEFKCKDEKRIPNKPKKIK